MFSPQIQETPRSNAHHVTQAVHDRAAAPKIHETPKACAGDGMSCRAETCRLMPAVGRASQNPRPSHAKARTAGAIRRETKAPCSQPAFHSMLYNFAVVSPSSTNAFKIKPDKSTRLDDYRRSLPMRQPIKRCAIEQPHHPLTAVRVTSPSHLRHKIASPTFSRETRHGFPNVVKTPRNRLVLIRLLRSTPPGPRESTHFFHRSERRKQSPTPSAPTIVMFFSEASESWLSVHPNNAPNSEKCLHPSFEALARRREIREVRTRVTTGARYC